MTAQHINISTNPEMNVKVERINDDYEWIQYNDKLRIIHSIKDDMFQMQSIITACNSNKRVNDWFRNQTTTELLESARDEISSAGIPALAKLYEKREDVPIELRGYYIHRLLVNQVSMWASPIYAWYIMKLLDDIFQKQREKLESVVEEQKPRMVPRNHEHDYKYLIWKEDIENNEQDVKLHLVRRHKSNFRVVNDKRKYTWFYRENLPNAMTPNKDVKNLVKKLFAGNDYTIGGSYIIIKKTHLETLFEEITNYFNNFQE